MLAESKLRASAHLAHEFFGASTLTHTRFLSHAHSPRHITCDCVGPDAEQSLISPASLSSPSSLLPSVRPLINRALAVSTDRFRRATGRLSASNVCRNVAGHVASSRFLPPPLLSLWALSHLRRLPSRLPARLRVRLRQFLRTTSKSKPITSGRFRLASEINNGRPCCVAQPY